MDGVADPASAATWLDLAMGAVLVAAGFFTWWRRPASITGLWICLASTLWLLAYPYPGTSLWHRVPLVVAVLAFPGTGRSRTPILATIGIAALAVAPPGVDSGALAVAGAIGLVTVLVVQSVRAHTTAQARAAGQALAAGALFAAALISGPLLRLGVSSVTASWLAPIVYALLTGAAALALAVATLGEDAGSEARRLIVDVGREARAMPSRIGRLIGDPTVRVGMWLAELQAYVDVEGRPLVLTAPEHAMTRFEDADGLPAAALIHDPRVTIDPRLAPAIATIARLSESTARAQNVARERVRLLEDSRLRLVRSADVERRRVATELQASVHPLLIAARTHLREAWETAPSAARADIDRLSLDIADATEDLFRLAAGTLPRALLERGLALALQEAVDRSPVPATATVTVRGLAPLVESTVYFVTVEALGNAIKHAGASRIDVVVTRDEDAVTATVTDDGHGIASGSEPPGTGLRGIRDRVEALGGSLVVRTESGTTVRAVVPLSAQVTASASTA